MSQTPHTAAVTDKHGPCHTLTAKAKQVGLGWEGYVEDGTTGDTVLTVTQRQRTKPAALKLAAAALDDFTRRLSRTTAK